MADRLARIKSAQQAAQMAADLASTLRSEDQDAAGDAQAGAEANEALDSVEMVQQMMIGVTEQAKVVSGAEKCTLWLVRPKTGMMWSFLSDVDGAGVKMASGEDAIEDAKQRILRIPVGNGLAGICAETGEVISIADGKAERVPTPRCRPHCVLGAVAAAHCRVMSRIAWVMRCWGRTLPVWRMHACSLER
jgi:hypothetical protein